MTDNKCPLCGLVEEGKECELMVVQKEEKDTKTVCCCTHLSTSSNKEI